MSDKAIACPHCGYTANRGGRSVQKTALSQSSANAFTRIVGVALIVLGVVSIPVALALGIFPVIGSFLIIGGGVHFIIGDRRGTCPYCGKNAVVSVNAANFKCPHCGKLSVKTGDYLEPVE